LYFFNKMVKWYYCSQILYSIMGQRTTPMSLYGIAKRKVRGKIKLADMVSKNHSAQWLSNESAVTITMSWVYQSAVYTRY
jgi:hypothetical protein